MTENEARLLRGDAYMDQSLWEEVAMCGEGTWEAGKLICGPYQVEIVLDEPCPLCCGVGLVSRDQVPQGAAVREAVGCSVYASDGGPVYYCPKCFAKGRVLTEDGARLLAFLTRHGLHMTL